MRVLVLAVSVVALAGAQEPKKDADTFARWEKEVAAIEKKLADKPPKPGCVVFAGSSTIRLWNLDKSFPDAGYVNVGFGGSQIPDATHFAGRLITPHQPKVVVFYAGDNDINANRTPEQVAADFKAFCAAVPNSRIIFLGIKPSLARWKRFDEQKKANARVREFCATDPRLTFLDTVPLTLGSDGTPDPALFVKDGLHLSPAGYEKWTAAVRKALEAGERRP